MPVDILQHLQTIRKLFISFLNRLLITCLLIFVKDLDSNLLSVKHLPVVLDRSSSKSVRSVRSVMLPHLKATDGNASPGARPHSNFTGIHPQQLRGDGAYAEALRATVITSSKARRKSAHG